MSGAQDLALSQADGIGLAELAVLAGPGQVELADHVDAEADCLAQAIHALSFYEVVLDQGLRDLLDLVHRECSEQPWQVFSDQGAIVIRERRTERHAEQELRERLALDKLLAAHLEVALAQRLMQPRPGRFL